MDATGTVGGEVVKQLSANLCCVYQVLPFIQTMYRILHMHMIL
jgi:hypothetical protein